MFCRSPGRLDERPGTTYTAAVDDASPQSSSTAAGWRIWQVIDSTFPVGGFAHSGGLEAAVQLGFTKSAADLQDFVRTTLWQSARLGAPFVIAIVRDAGRFDALNEQYDALTINAVANAASRAQAAAMLSAADAILQDETVAAARARLRAARGFAHLPLSFGLLAAAAGMTADGAVDAYFYQQARSLFSAAVRLSLVGPMEAQRLLLMVADDRAALIDTALATPTAAAAQSSPVLDLLQNLHERLYSRLFVS